MTLKQLIANRDVTGIKDFMAAHELILAGNKIVAGNKSHIKEQEAFWNQRQSAKKITLNSFYGSILNESFRMYDTRVGQSTTLCGRTITKHMCSKINEVITGKYDYKGQAVAYADTDSIKFNSIISTNIGPMTIEKLFRIGDTGWKHGDKEYSVDNTIKVLGYDRSNDTSEFYHITYVYRHKVSKGQYKVTVDNTFVIVTEDHSIMIERNGILMEVKPYDILDTDISIHIDITENIITRSTIAVEQLEDFDNEYVYDIGIANGDPYFFANNILVHNSCYFSAYEVLKDDPQFVDYEWSKENIISLYDGIADEANDSFPEFMQKTFNTNLTRGSKIKAGRELVASKALFIVKKKYALIMYDKEGKRLDKDSPGELKAMGLDLKRSDTPKFMQKFLEKLLYDLLTDVPNEVLYDRIKQFRKDFKNRPGWEKGSPKKVSEMSAYGEREFNNLEADITKAKKTKVPLPGHVRASLNWNKLCEINNDKYSTRIGDGARIVVCQLKNNITKMTSVAYPVDEPHLPEWFKKLPFDHARMEEVIIDKKLDNLLGVLKWDLEGTKERPGDEFFI